VSSSAPRWPPEASATSNSLFEEARPGRVSEAQRRALAPWWMRGTSPCDGSSGRQPRKTPASFAGAINLRAGTELLVPTGRTGRDESACTWRRSARLGDGTAPAEQRPGPSSVWDQGRRAHERAARCGGQVGASVAGEDRRAGALHPPPGGAWRPPRRKSQTPHLPASPLLARPRRPGREDDHQSAANPISRFIRNNPMRENRNAGSPMYRQLGRFFEREKGFEPSTPPWQDGRGPCRNRNLPESGEQDEQGRAPRAPESHQEALRVQARRRRP
jgi:hypothetical protein